MKRLRQYCQYSLISYLGRSSREKTLFTYGDVTLVNQCPRSNVVRTRVDYFNLLLLLISLKRAVYHGVLLVRGLNRCGPIVCLTHAWIAVYNVLECSTVFSSSGSVFNIIPPTLLLIAFIITHPK